MFLLRRFLPISIVLLATGISHAGLGPHDVTPVTHDAGGPCVSCHNTSLNNATRGWGKSITDNGTTTGWFTRPITALCYTCHQANNGLFASDQSARAMSLGSHLYTVSNAPPKVNFPGVRDNQAVVNSGLPYTRDNLECTTCHNPHNDQYRPFLSRPTIRELCVACHPGRDFSAIRTENTAGAYNVSVHPVNVPMDNSIGGAASIKTIAQMDNALKTASQDNTWKLGGKLTGGGAGNVSCETCHAVHGTAQGATGIELLLAIDNRFNDSGTANNPLCEGCHFGGLAGGFSGLPGTADHPADNNPGRAFYPSGVSIPDEWSNPQRLDRGLAVLNSQGIPRCSSCHDAHGGGSGTSILRSPVPSRAYGGEWCYSCHTANPQVTPGSHHSVQGTEEGLYTSNLTCASCHNRGLSSHNGFYQTYVQDNVPGSFSTPRGRTVTKGDVASNTDSALCVYCHSDGDPVRSRTDNTALGMPAPHGAYKGSASHYLGVVRNPFRNPLTGQAMTLPLVLKADSWATDNNSFSKYGKTPGGGGSAPVPDGNSEVICESCHSVLHNDAAVHPALSKYSNRTTSGWAYNLLLKPYEDDPAGVGNGTGTGYGVGVELCMGCHPFDSAVNHHPTYPIDFTKADQTDAPLSGTPAPGVLSIPQPNRIDCDTCHRPHSANSYSDASPDSRYTQKVFLILEVDNTDSQYHQLCGQCHSQ